LYHIGRFLHGTPRAGQSVTFQNPCVFFNVRIAAGEKATDPTFALSRNIFSARRIARVRHRIRSLALEQSHHPPPA
jgi:hypothetical protein